MNPSAILKRFLHTGNKPSSTREVSALLDESRSLLVSKLPTTSETIQNFSDGEIDTILAGGKSGVMDRAYAIYNEKEGRFVKTGNPLATPPTPAPRPAAKAPRPAPAASKPAVVNRASATATKPSAPAPLATITANQFAKPELRMTRSEFDKLSPADKGRFCAEGGKLVADPNPAKK
jgi:hypothetical protein